MRRPAVLALLLTVLAFAPTAAAQPPERAPLVAAVGDIACKNLPGNNPSVCQYDDVAAGIRAGGYDAFLVLGDVQYESGEYADFVGRYGRYFDPLLPISWPVPGNHEYQRDAAAAGYFAYFGARAGIGYYAFDMGAWRVIALNSAICPAVTGCGPGHPQFEWLAAELAANPSEAGRCTLAYWHHPRTDWLHYQNADWTNDYEFLRTKPFWDLLAGAGADVVLAGHNHLYSRWAPMDADLRPAADGIVQFISGTGGRNLNGFGALNTRPSTFATGWSGGFGHLELRLERGRYDHRFVASPGQPAFSDIGEDVACH